jgi:hypothetical protein
MSDDDAPALSIGGLSLWVLGRAYSEASNPYDADWLEIRALCLSGIARVELSGVGLRSIDIEGFADQLQQMHTSLKGDAWLDGSDIGLTGHLQFSDSYGHVRGEVEITADHGRERHKFTFSCDQTDLPPLIAGCRAIVAHFPVQITRRS